MAVDRWFFGGGAEHTPESARRALYASTSGAEGVGGSGDLKVVPLETPGQGVRVLIGSALIRSRYIGGETQTYMGTVYEQEVVETTPTGSGQTRADLVVMRVEDPYAAGSPYTPPVEEDRATAPYIHIRVIPGVPANTTRLQDVAGYQNDTAITLARINFPASTGTVTSGMITDLREVAQPKTETVVRAFNMTSAGQQTVTSTAAYPGGNTWPAEAEEEGILNIDIPEWATYVKVVYTVSGWVAPGNGNAYGRFWFQIAPTSHPNRIISQPTRWSLESSNVAYRSIVRVADTKRIPTALRGTTQKFYPRANREHGSTSQSIYADWATSVDILVVFQEQAD